MTATTHAEPRRLLLTYLGPQRARMVPLAALILVGIALQLAAPWLFGRFVDAARGGEALSTLSRFGLAFIGLTLLAQILNVLTGLLASQVGWAATNALRLDLTQHVLSRAPEFFRRHTPGALIERVDGDAGLLSAFFSRLLVDLLGNALLLIGVIVLLLGLDLLIGLSAAVFAALALWGLTAIRQLSRSVWLGVRDVTTRVFGLVGEALSGIEDLRPNGALPYVWDRFFTLLREWQPLQVRAMQLFGAAWALPLLVFALGDAMAFLLAAQRHRTGVLTLGTATTVFFYIALMARPIDEIRQQLQNIQRVDASLTRIGALLAETSAIEDTGTQALTASAPAVEFDHVTFAYAAGETPVIDSLTLHLAPGRSVGLLGRTGSGKTTLSRLLFRLADPQGGEIRLGGVPLQQFALSELRSRVALVTQDVQLFSATVRDNLTFFDAAVPEDRVWAALDMAGLRAWCTALGGLNAQVRPGALSAGEAQLLALARLTLKEPALVILDEASSRLDRVTEAQLDLSLRRVLKGRTSVVIAHRLATVAHLDDILILDRGRVVEFGPREILAADPHSAFSALIRAGQSEVLA